MEDSQLFSKSVPATAPVITAQPDAPAAAIQTQVTLPEQPPAPPPEDEEDPFDSIFRIFNKK
jgi:hypothetical protein